MMLSIRLSDPGGRIGDKEHVIALESGHSMLTHLSLAEWCGCRRLVVVWRSSTHDDALLVRSKTRCVQLGHCFFRLSERSLLKVLLILLAWRYSSAWLEYAPRQVQSQQLVASKHLFCRVEVWWWVCDVVRLNLTFRDHSGVPGPQIRLCLTHRKDLSSSF